MNDDTTPHPNDRIPLDKLVRVFLAMRREHEKKQRKDKIDAETRKGNMRKIENELLRRANDQGAEGFTTKYGTVYSDEDLHVSIADENIFRKFLEDDEDPFGWYTKRVRLERVTEYMKNNEEFPPGLNVFREKRMKIRAKASTRGRKQAQQKGSNNAEDDSSDD